jgi:hypothetical protein
VCFGQEDGIVWAVVSRNLCTKAVQILALTQTHLDKRREACLPCLHAFAPSLGQKRIFALSLPHTYEYDSSHDCNYCTGLRQSSTFAVVSLSQSWLTSKENEIFLNIALPLIHYNNGRQTNFRWRRLDSIRLLRDSRAGRNQRKRKQSYSPRT